MARPTAPTCKKGKGHGPCLYAIWREGGASTSGAHEFPSAIHILPTSFESPPDPLKQTRPVCRARTNRAALSDHDGDCGHSSRSRVLLTWAEL